MTSQLPRAPATATELNRQLRAGRQPSPPSEPNAVEFGAPIRLVSEELRTVWGAGAAQPAGKTGAGGRLSRARFLNYIIAVLRAVSGLMWYVVHPRPPMGHQSHYNQLVLESLERAECLAQQYSNELLDLARISTQIDQESQEARSDWQRSKIQHSVEITRLGERIAALTARCEELERQITDLSVTATGRSGVGE